MPCAVVLFICATQIQSLVRGHLTRTFLKLLQPNWPAVACNAIDPITQEPFSSPWTMHIQENRNLFQFSVSTLMCQVPHAFRTNPFTRNPLDVDQIRHRIHRMVQLRNLSLLNQIEIDWPYMKTQNYKRPNNKIIRLLRGRQSHQI